MRNQLNDWHDYIFAGRAVFTVVSGRDGTRYTFQINRVPRPAGENEEEKPLPKCKCENGKWNGRTCVICKGTGFKQPVYFLSLLTGRDNTKDYSYIGIANQDPRRLEQCVITTPKSGDYPKQLAVARWLLWLAVNKQSLPEGYEIWHEGRCGRCGKPLTVPNSIATGLGPICAGRI